MLFRSFGSGAGMADSSMPQSAAQEIELSNDFMPEWAVPEVPAPQTEPAGNFMPEMEMPGWDMQGNVFAESSRQPGSMGLFSEDAAPTKIYEPKRHKKESGFAFPKQGQAAEPAGNDWMIYG